MSEPALDEGRILRSEAARLTVAEVMSPAPKTLAADALVADVRRLFERPSVRTVLLADGVLFRGAIERDRLPDGAADDEPAAAYADLHPVSVRPELAMSEAIALMESRSEPRLIVLDEDGVTLRGLLCAKRDVSEFCIR